MWRMRARSSRWAAAPVQRIGGGCTGVREVGNVKLMARAVEGIEMKDLKSLADDGKKQLGSGVVAIVGVTEDGKAGVVVGVTSDLTSRFNAVDLVRWLPKRSAARAAAGGPTWRRPAGPTAPRRARRSSAIEKAMGSVTRLWLPSMVWRPALRWKADGYFVMAGLVPAIHASLLWGRESVIRTSRA